MEKFVFLFSCFNLSPRDTYILTRWIQKSNPFFKKFFVFLETLENTGLSGIFFKIVSKIPKISETCCIAATLETLKNPGFFGNLLSFFYNRQNLFHGLGRK
jgi:hypothetical protein